MQLTQTISSSPENLGTTHTLINSENLQWLKHELETNQLNLAGNLDVCYIDPPYNTGNTTDSGFAYHDDREHDEWLTFMEERLTILQQFLKPTGVIIASIDDSEVHHLRILLDKVFGRNNFVAQITIDGGANKNNARFFSVTHEYMLVYAKSLTKLKKSGIKWRQSREGVHLLLNQYELLKEEGKTPEEITVFLKKWVKDQPFTPRLKKFHNADKNGLYTYVDLSVPGNRYEYEVFHPVTGKVVAEPSRGWGLNKEKFDKLVEDDMIIWGKDEKGQPLKKLYLVDKKDQLMKSVLAYPSRSSTHILENLLGKRGAFAYPKNLEMMKDVLDYIMPEDGVVLDCFAGTGTTGHAILELNAENLSRRKFVLVTNNENNIFDEVTFPRLQKVHDNLRSSDAIDVWNNN